MTVGIILTCDARFMAQLTEELAELTEKCKMSVLSPGILFLQTANTSLHRRLLVETPLFLRHMFPVQRIVELPGSNSDSDVVVACTDFAAESLRGLAAPQQVGVQCRALGNNSLQPRDIKAAVDQWLHAHHYVPTVKYPQYIISVLSNERTLYLGFSTPQENLTSWSGGAVHYRAGEDLLSRSGHKLEEAIEVLGIPIDNTAQALDLGAAPGGWTKLLLSKGLKVTAVDTGELSLALTEHPRLTYLKQNAFDLKLPAARYKVLTCDMSWDPLRTARLLNQLAPVLQPQGKLIMTIKFMGNKPLTIIRRCLELLAHEYLFVRGRHLWHNREEVTLYLQRR